MTTTPTEPVHVVTPPSVIAKALRIAAEHLETRNDSWPTNGMRAVADYLEAQAADDADLDVAAEEAWKKWNDARVTYASETPLPWRQQPDGLRLAWQKVARVLRDRYRKDNTQ